MKIPAPLDVHAHVDLEIDVHEVRLLGAFIFAMTRSLREFETASKRSDPRMIWGVGVHPGLVRSIKAFDSSEFERIVVDTPLVGEVGLDGSSRVPMSDQVRVFRSVLETLSRHPRLVSVHSAGAQLQVLRELHRTPIRGVILHWWTGSVELTEEAIRLGCYFSLPPAMMSKSDLLALIPKDRLLAETDHPSGDRYTGGRKRPGNVREVENKLANLHGQDPFDIRIACWRNLARLAGEMNLMRLFPTDWSVVLNEVAKPEERI